MNTSRSRTSVARWRYLAFLRQCGIIIRSDGQVMISRHFGDGRP